MSLDAVDLLADIFFQIIECVEVRRFAGDGAHFFGELRAEFVLFYLQQATIGVVDDNEFLCVEQVMGNDQRADRIICGDASGVANHVSVAGPETQAMLEQDTGIHASQDRGVAARADRKVSQVKTARENFVRG